MTRLIDADELNEYIGRESLDTREKIFALVDRMPTLPNPCGKPCAFERPQWIPVAERLPEEIGDYLVTEHLSDIAQAVYVSSFGHVRTGELCFYYEDDDGRTIKNDGIVAWMSLPEPYKGGH